MKKIICPICHERIQLRKYYHLNVAKCYAECCQIIFNDNKEITGYIILKNINDKIFVIVSDINSFYIYDVDGDPDDFVFKTNQMIHFPIIDDVLQIDSVLNRIFKLVVFQ